MKLLNHRSRRYLKLFYLKGYFLFSFKRRADERIKRPTNLNPLQKMAVDISIKVMLNPMSKLYYDITTQECYVKHDMPEGTIYVFIEAMNVKIINTVFGYDIPMTMDAEQYLTHVFRREMAKRRSQFKNEALAKVDFSLHTVLDRINERL